MTPTDDELPCDIASVVADLQGLRMLANGRLDNSRASVVNSRLNWVQKDDKTRLRDQLNERLSRVALDAMVDAVKSRAEVVVDAYLDTQDERHSPDVLPPSSNIPEVAFRIVHDVRCHQRALNTTH